MLFILQVNMKMREITERDHKVKHHPLESPSHQKVKLLSVQYYFTEEDSKSLTVPHYPHFQIVNFILGSSRAASHK